MEAKYIIFYLLSLLSFKIYSTSCCNSCKGSQDNTKKQNYMTNNNNIKTNPNLNTNVKTTNKKNKNNNTEKNNINTKLNKYYKKKDTTDKKNYNNIDLNQSQGNKIKNSKIKNKNLNDEKEEKEKEDKLVKDKKDKEGNKSSEEENKSVKEEEEEEEEDKSIKEKEEKKKEDKSLKGKEENEENKSSEEEDSDDESVNNDTKWEIQINDNKIDITKDELSNETFKDLNIVNCDLSKDRFIIFKIDNGIYEQIQLKSDIKLIHNDRNTIDKCEEAGFTLFSIKSNEENYYIILYGLQEFYKIFTGDNLSNINEIKLIYLNKSTRYLSYFFSYVSDENDDKSGKNVDKNKIKKIYIFETFFSGKVEKMNYMFSGCKELIKIEGLGNLKTDSCKEMIGMFQNCSSIEEIDLSNWNIANSAYLNDMFFECKNLKKVKFPKETVITYGYINNMFEGCENLKTIDLSSIKETKHDCSLEDILGKGCNNIQEITISDGLFHELIYTEIGDYKNLKKIVIYINDKENYNKILNEYEEKVAIFNKNLNTQGYKLNIEEKKELTIYTYSRNNP